MNPFFAVSKGAAFWPYLRNEKCWVVKEKMHDSVFLKRTGHPFLPIFTPTEIPSEVSTVRFTAETCPHLPKGGRQVRLDFFQGTSAQDHLMELAHIEYLKLETELEPNSRLVEVSSAINANKVYEFTLSFEDAKGIAIAKVAFGAADARNPTSGGSLIELNLNGSKR